MSNIKADDEKNGNVIPRSRILIEFDGSSSVLFRVTVENVIPMQLLALSHWFEFEGKNALAQQKVIEAQQAQAQMGKIARPGDNGQLIIPKPKLQ